MLKCLQKVEGYNVLVCVSRHVGGCFVADMVQYQKHKTVKEAATKVLEVLLERIVGNKNFSFHSIPSTGSGNVTRQKR